MSVYVHDIPLEEAEKRFSHALQVAGLNKVLGMEAIPLDISACGRVLAESVWAKISSPYQHEAAMDGYAVRSDDTRGATQTRPLLLQIPDQARYVDTGDPLPEIFDAIVPIENVEAISQDDQPGRKQSANLQAIRIRAAVAPWQHVRPLGEDMVATQLVLAAGHTLRPIDLGAIAACGHVEVVVSRKPKVAVLPTGNELIEIGQPVTTGKNIEYNSLVLAGQIANWGGEPTCFPIIPDDLKQLTKQIQQAVKDHDLILINAGSSAGSEDYTAQAIEKLGEMLVHGVAVRPGHPVILGMVHRQAGVQVPVIGVPGYPVSAALTNEIFVEPLLSLWQGRKPASPLIIEAELTQKVTSPPGDDDFIRVVVGRVGGRMLAAPLKRGAGVISSLVQADGLALLPRGSQGQPAGAKVSVRLYRRPEDLEKTIFAIGSHDLTIDLLAQFLIRHDRRLAAANVGSIGGLVALRRGEAHLAGSHLLDPKTGEYNLPFVREYLPETPAKIIGLVERQQGLIVKKGNPKRIHSLEDLASQGIRFVNRQRGAGTRVLLDYHLDQLGIEALQIQGYDHEEYTHLSLAAAVASGRADCGLGIHAAAAALELDFISLFKERYDLIVPLAFAESALLGPLWLVLEDPAFRDAIEVHPGYSTSPLGKLISIIQ